MEERLPRKLAAILYADVVGYSRLTGEDEDATHHHLRQSLDLLSTAIEHHEGRVVHYAGDALLADFSNVSNALLCVTAAQNELRAHNDKLPEERRLMFRIGLNIGEVIEDRGDIYADGVNVAARLEALAAPGGICGRDHGRPHHRAVEKSLAVRRGAKLDLRFQRPIG
jgi:adenylate cyclase